MLTSRGHIGNMHRDGARDAHGRLVPIDPFVRFREKCRFDPTTGCVVWTGGRTRGRGNSAEYGAFKFEGRRWYAHRWAAVFIHGLDVGKLTVGHYCPHTPDGHPNTLCVQHVRPETLADNIAEMNERRARERAEQANDVRQYWLLVDRGYEPAPPVSSGAPGDVPFFPMPDWLRVGEPVDTDCPF